MLGQIIYNLEDYANSGGMISTRQDPGQTDYTCSIDIGTGGQNESYIHERINIYNGIFNGRATNVTKLGIQAPPGTQFKINVTNEQEEAQSEQAESLTIMVGRSGIYELDEGLKIQELSFQRPHTYVLDKTASEDARNTGMKMMRDAMNELQDVLQAIGKKEDTAISTITQSDFWADYQESHQQYVDKYNEGRSLYIQGLSGIYKQSGSELMDLRNIIVDYVYTTIEEGL